MGYKSDCWDAIHPAALLIIREHELLTPEQMQEEIQRSLDTFGWLDNKGKPDVQRAEREIKRFLSKTIRVEE